MSLLSFEGSSYQASVGLSWFGKKVSIFCLQDRELGNCLHVSDHTKSNVPLNIQTMSIGSHVAKLLRLHQMKVPEEVLLSWDSFTSRSPTCC